MQKMFASLTGRKHIHLMYIQCGLIQAVLAGVSGRKFEGSWLAEGFK